MSKKEAVVALAAGLMACAGDPEDVSGQRAALAQPGVRAGKMLFDWEAFDMPQLRGIARTAPYFHDNSRATLAEVIDEYSRFVLPLLTPLGLPSLPPEADGLPPEALTKQQKQDLLSFLERL